MVLQSSFFFLCPAMCSEPIVGPPPSRQEGSPAQKPDHGIRPVLQHRQRRRVTDVPLDLAAWVAGAPGRRT